MEVKKVTRTKDIAGLRDIYITAFPKAERLPVFILDLLAKRSYVRYLAFYDEETLCGMTYIIDGDDMSFLLYLAVNSELRSKGYGSKILGWVKENSPSVVLCIESLDNDRGDMAQKKRRQAFYFKNGFRDSGRNMTDSGGEFDILVCGADLDAEKFRRLLRHYATRLYRVKIY